MKVFKFGGASVNSASAVRNVAEILKMYQNDKLLVVISAMGKMTNALEKLTFSYFYNKPDLHEIYKGIADYHYEISTALFNNESHRVFKETDTVLKKLKSSITSEPNPKYDFVYDQIVSCGEILSTLIVSNYLNSININNKYLDASKLIQTDETYREGKVDWILTSEKIKKTVLPVYNDNQTSVIITQGFIGGNSENFKTTLGREGSDYSAAIFAHVINASEMIIWKDVPGLLNADPKFFEETQKLDAISYREAIELAYYGATIIHPKTIKPLQNKNIPLLVKSFLHPENEGTIISEKENTDALIPSYIFKHQQMLISVSPKDFSFIAEDNLSEIFGIFSANRIKINLMQNSAISFSICIDGENKNVDNMIAQLQQKFKVRYNSNLELITIRHYDQPTIDKVSRNRKILLEQRSRLTAQLIVEN